jgi:hypothetical protein
MILTMHTRARTGPKADAGTRPDTRQRLAHYLAYNGRFFVIERSVFFHFKPRIHFEVRQDVFVVFDVVRERQVFSTLRCFGGAVVPAHLQIIF